ncbi:MAG TPA: prolipoprotein diacylglyceryl transferase family protein, partial [Gemmatimonadaceae bacterium]|nr:prolipoprotein diacylglyceryl transferase family protein [Gemmatimonadaceae bacterium]
AITWRIARRHRRADQSLLTIVAGGLLVAAIFARYGLLFRYLQEASTPDLDGFLRYGGRTLLGGLAGAYIGVVVTKRLIGYRRHTGDLLAPGVALGIAIGRLGCFLTERPGTPTTLPWGVHVPPDAAARYRDCEACATGAAMHPSFLYESAFLAAAGWWLLRLDTSDKRPAAWMKEGDLFKLFLAAYAVFRLLVERVRGNPVMAFGLSGSQLMVLPAIAALALYFLREWRAARFAAAAPSLT